MQNYSLTSAFEASKNDDLKNWAISYLNSEGNNHGLAQIIQNTPCKHIELTEAPLHGLIRICGPEKGMAFPEDISVWESRISTLRQAINSGIELPPLIITDFWEASQISDGAHRYEALIRNGITKYWAIFFDRE